jgi:hypothetical protein
MNRTCVHRNIALMIAILGLYRTKCAYRTVCSKSTWFHAIVTISIGIAIIIIIIIVAVVDCSTSTRTTIAG